MKSFVLAATAALALCFVGAKEAEAFGHRKCGHHHGCHSHHGHHGYGYCRHYERTRCGIFGYRHVSRTVCRGCGYHQCHCDPCKCYLPEGCCDPCPPKCCKPKCYHHHEHHHHHPEPVDPPTAPGPSKPSPGPKA